jgi:hypothetical protein
MQGNISVDFEATGQLLVTNSAFIKYFHRNWENSEAVQQLFIVFKKAVTMDVLYVTAIEFGITMKLVR